MRLSNREQQTRSGSLTVVGTGIQAGIQLTAEARAALEQADEVLYLVSNSFAEAWLQRLRPDALSLAVHYELGRPRLDVYAAIADAILTAVRRGADVCAAFYGHPGVFVHPSHEAVRRARLEGFPARMLPGVSAEDCLFADLGIDPAVTGVQSYEATNFLFYVRQIDTSAALVLWQVSVVGETDVVEPPNRRGLAILADHLQTLYPAEHEVTLYEASPYPVGSPLVQTMPLSQLATAEPTPLATLYVPPAARRRRNDAMIERLGFGKRGKTAAQREP